MKYYIGADLGTSALKLLLVSTDRKILRSVTKAYEVSYPQPGWSEQNPEDWWTAFTEGIRELICDVDSEQIEGLAVAGQMHGLVILDEKDEVIRPAILWNDGRTEKETDFLNNSIGKEKLSALTANVAFAGFTAPKILWLRENEPQSFAKISKIMLPKDYINYRLTGNHATDYSDASGMLLLDVKNRCWSKEMLQLCSVTEVRLPRLYESYQSIGVISPKIARELGLPQAVTVAAGAGDNAAAAIGTATVGEGKCNISLGTSGTIFISSEAFGVDENNALHSFCHADGAYHLMGCMLSAASCNKWFCDEVLKADDYALEQAAIAEDRLGQNDTFFLPYLMGERSPVNDTDATGMFIGLRPNTQRADMLQAVLEGVAFAVRDNLEVAKKLGIQVQRSTVCGGGTKSKLWLKILCNVLNIELYIPQFEEGPGYGAAILAMTACGMFDTVSAGVSCDVKEIIRPDENLVRLYEKKYRQYARIYPSVKQLFKTIKRDK